SWRISPRGIPTRCGSSSGAGTRRPGATTCCRSTIETSGSRSSNRAATPRSARTGNSGRHCSRSLPMRRPSPPPPPTSSPATPADIERPTGREDGGLVAYGSRFYGYVLYVQDGHLVYEIGLAPRAHRLRSERKLPAGRCQVRFEMEMVERPLRGVGRLLADN